MENAASGSVTGQLEVAPRNSWKLSHSEDKSWTSFEPRHSAKKLETNWSNFSEGDLSSGRKQPMFQRFLVQTADIKITHMKGKDFLSRCTGRRCIEQREQGGRRCFQQTCRYQTTTDRLCDLHENQNQLRRDWSALWLQTETRTPLIPKHEPAPAEIIPQHVSLSSFYIQRKIYII